jgi:hypothetical protein
MLLSVSSCSQAVIREPQPVYVISTKFLTVAKGQKSFNYKLGPEQMGEWVKDPALVKWSELPENLVAFPLETWLVKIKPVLKDISRKRRDRND